MYLACIFPVNSTIAGLTEQLNNVNAPLPYLGFPFVSVVVYLTNGPGVFTPYGYKQNTN